MARCQICQKGPVTGGKVIRTGTGKWVKKRVKKVRKPNLQKATLLAKDGKEKKIVACTKCLKRLKKEGKIKTYQPQSA